MWEKDECFFNELEKCIGEFYVIEEETQSIVYMSESATRACKNAKLGEKCYTVLHGRKSRCPFCIETLENKGIKQMDGYVCAKDVADSKMLDSYIPADKKWYQYKMSTYCSKGVCYRIVIRCEVENMMKLSYEAITMTSDYKNLYEENTKRQKSLSYAATHDGMTELYNKGQYLYDISKITDNEKPIGIVVCDVNNLKKINDTYGHMIGDDVISEIANIFKTLENENVRCYRIGGDEFAILQKNSNENAIKEIALKINEQVENHHDKRVDLASGYSVFRAGESFEEAFWRADKNMYENKKASHKCDDLYRR